MIDQDLVKRNLVGRDGFTWWIGQIPSSKVWKMNTPGTKVKSNDDIKGFDYRYKVRIMGYHTANVNDLKDEQLPWAGVMFPITAGVSGGAIDTPQIMQGNFVYGFFLDGPDAQVPIIMGLIGYNQYTKVLKEVPETPFQPFSGYEPTSNKNSEFVGTDQVGGNKEVKDGDVAESNDPPPADGGSGDANAPDINSDGIIGDSPSASEQITSGADKEQERNRSKPKTLPTNSRCEPSPTPAIQREMKNMLNDIQQLKQTANDWEAKVSTKLDNLEDEIQKVTSKATKEITGNVKRIVDGIQRNVKKKINKKLTETYHLVLPSERPSLAKEISKANESLGCMFKNMTDNLFGMVSGFLNQILDRYINAPLCAIENFVGGLLGNITGILDSGIANIISPIKHMVSALGGAIDIGSDIIGFATDALTILDCKPDPKCSDAKEWSPGQGPVIIAKLDVNSIISKARGISSVIQSSAARLGGALEDITDIAGNMKNAGNMLQNLAGQAIDSCNVGPLFCGPPTVSFSGGGGNGAGGNAIVSTATAILGVDLSLPGSGYITPPKVVFNDDCGKGKGASARAVLGPVKKVDDNFVADTTVKKNEDGTYPEGTNLGVVSVVMEETGVGYLPFPDGSQGGDGTTYANPNETIIKRADGTYHNTPYKPGVVVEVFEGDEITHPGGIKENVKVDSTITTQDQGDQVVPRGEDPTLNDGTYPVVLEIDDVAISNPGVGYSDSDTVVIEPSNGAEVRIKTDELGSIIGTEVINGGIGFQDEPEVYIKSKSGYNGRLLPVYKVNRQGIDAGFVTPQNIPTIEVVDCVGKVSHLGKS